MAAVIGDLVPDASRFRGLLVTSSSLQRAPASDAASPRRRRRRRSTASSNSSSSSSSSSDSSGSSSNSSSSNSRRRRRRRPTTAATPPRLPASTPAPAPTPSPTPTPTPASPRRPISPRHDDDDDDDDGSDASLSPGHDAHAAPHRPRPPPAPDGLASSLPAAATPQPDGFTAGPAHAPSPVADDEKGPAAMASSTQDGARPLARSPPAAPMSSPPARRHDEAAATTSAHDDVVVAVRDLAHVQALAAAEKLGANASHTKYDISAMPMADVIEMVAALLTKITSTNDLQHDALQRNAAHQQQASQTSDSSSMSHSVLAFHGKNVPAITILSYLSRIHKYCPTTYEVFLSLLVYFDRMTERVNDMAVKAGDEPPKSPPDDMDSDLAVDDLADDDDDLADDADLGDDDAAKRGADVATVPETVSETQPAASGPITCFVVDSFNIHRLIIAGVTCASKFFSDVFYTNSRYAKVGGLPLAELNHLEIQFLVLNDFRLAVPVEDLEAYATMLVEFYARDVIAQNAAAPGSQG